MPCITIEKIQAPGKGTIADSDSVENSSHRPPKCEKILVKTFPSMGKVLKTLRAVQWALLASIVLYALVGEIAGPQPRGPDPALSYIFSTLTVAIVGTIFIVRRTLVLQAAASLATHPDDSLSLSHWRTGYVVTYALCEMLALFGLVLRFRASPLQQSVLFYLGGFVLIAFFGPRLPAKAPEA